MGTLSPFFVKQEQAVTSRFGVVSPPRQRKPCGGPGRPCQEGPLYARSVVVAVPQTTEVPKVAPAARRPRVGIVSPSWTVGGVERWWLSLCRLAEGLDLVGVAVTEAESSHLIDPAVVAEGRRFCPVLCGTGAVESLLPLCDVVIVWGTDYSPAFDGFAGKVLFVSHGMGDWTRQKAASWLPRADALAAVSRSALLPFPAEVRDRVTIVHNGIDFDRITPRRRRSEIRAEWGLSPDALAVGYCGRYSPEKNPTAAARAVSKLSYATAVYQCPPLSRPFARAAVPSITDRCRFLEGPVADFYTGVDCLVMASEQEGFALAITEAWAAGVPVVATNVGAIDEMEETHGHLVVRVAHDASDSDLSVAVQAAVSESSRPMVDRATALAWSHFSSGRMARDWERLIAGLM